MDLFLVVFSTEMKEARECEITEILTVMYRNKSVQKVSGLVMAERWMT